MQTSLAHNETRILLNSRLQQLSADGFHSVLLAHYGELNQDLINSLTVSVEEMMISAGDRKQLIKRAFSILIEGLQNVLIHGERTDGEQLSLLIVAVNGSHYRLILGNSVPLSEQEKLAVYLEKLNTMTEDEMKAYYLEVLNNGLLSSKGGAGLGFITMRLKSRALLRYSFEPSTDGLAFFTIETDLARQDV